MEFIESDYHPDSSPSSPRPGITSIYTDQLGVVEADRERTVPSAKSFKSSKTALSETDADIAQIRRTLIASSRKSDPLDGEGEGEGEEEERVTSIDTDHLDDLMLRDEDGDSIEELTGSLGKQRSRIGQSLRGSYDNNDNTSIRGSKSNRRRLSSRQPPAVDTSQSSIQKSLTKTRVSFADSSQASQISPRSDMQVSPRSFLTAQSIEDKTDKRRTLSHSTSGRMRANTQQSLLKTSYSNHMNMSYYGCKNPNQAVVIDIGSYQMRAGFAGDAAPKHIFNSAVASVLDEEGKTAFYVGKEAMGKPQCHYPYKKGLVSSW